MNDILWGGLITSFFLLWSLPTTISGGPETGRKRALGLIRENETTKKLLLERYYAFSVPASFLISGLVIAIMKLWNDAAPAVLLLLGILAVTLAVFAGWLATLPLYLLVRQMKEQKERRAARAKR